MNIFELSGKVMLDDNDAQKKIEGIDGSGKKLDGRLGGMIKTAGKWGAALAAGAVAASAAIGGAVIKYGNFADELLDLSAITGMSTDDMQRWRQVAVDAGVDTDTMANAMKTLNGQLERGNEISPRLAKAFETMNMTADEFKNVNPDEQMRLLVGTMMDLEEKDRRAFANQMNMADMLPMISELEAEGKSLDEIMDGIDVPFSEEDLDKMNEVRKSWDNIKQAVFETIGKALLPVFDWVNDNMPLIESIIETTVEKVGEFIGWWIEFVDELIEKFTTWKTNNQETLDAIKEAFETAFDFVIELLGDFGDAIEEAREFVEKYWGILEPILIGIAGGALAFGVITGAVAAWNIVVGIATATTAAFGAVMAFITSPIGIAVIAIAAIIAIGVALYKNWDTVMAWGRRLGSTIKGVFTDMGNSIANIWGRITASTDKFKNKVIAIVKLLMQGIKAPFNGIIGFANGVIGAFEGLIGGLGKAINKIPSFDIPKWVPGIGGKSFGLPNIASVSMPRIPSLDVGTNKVLSDGLAMIHKGEEIRPAKHSGKYTGTDGSIDLRIDLDGRQIMKALRVPMSKEIRLATGLKL